MQTPATEQGGAAPEPGVIIHAGLMPATLKQRYAAWSLDAACLLPLLLLLGGSHLQHDMANASAALTSLKQALPRLMEAMQTNPQPTMQMAQAWLDDPVLADGVGRLEAALGDMLLTPMVLYALLALVGSVGFESSRWQATPGKLALGLVVAGADGKKLTTGHALQRFLASSLSWLSLNIGHAMAALPPKHLALHDRLSDTRVVRERNDARLPAWAWGWLILQGAASLAAFLWLFIRLQTAMNTAMQQVMGQL
ncbi:MAG: RDD family protein [Thermomonas sp.]